MKRLLDTLVWLGIFLCGTLLACMLAYPALAQERGTGIICDTEAQLRQYAAIAEEPDAIQTVNTEAGDESACGMVTVAFFVGDSHGQVRTPLGAFAVTEILVVGAHMPQGWVKIKPLTQFTLFRVKEEES